MLSYGFHPKLIYPTRLAYHSASLIDNIFSNEPSTFPTTSGILISNISDHFPYFCGFGKCTQYNHSIKYIYQRNVDQNKLNNLYEYLESQNLLDKLKSLSSNDPNILYNTLENELTFAINKYIPLSKKRNNKYKIKHINWITFGIIKSIKYRDKMYKLFKKTEIASREFNIHKHNLKVYNSILKKIILKAKKLYYGNQFNKNRNDVKQTWNTINELIRRKSNPNLPEYFIHDNNKVTNPKQIAEYFNNYYGSIGNTMASSITYNGPYTPDKYLNFVHDKTLNFEHVENKTVADIIKNLKN